MHFVHVNFELDETLKGSQKIAFVTYVGQFL